MAPVLQCPDCGEKHPLDVASGTVSFLCRGCGRVLKVPGQFRDAPPRPATGDAVRTRAQPAAAGVRPRSERAQPAAGARADAHADARVPLMLRFLLWLVAVPVGFAVVFALARLAGVFTARDLEDVSLDEGWDRFWPVARLLPVVALVIAAIVHGSVLAIARRRGRRTHPVPSAAGRAPQSGSRAREPARPVS